MNTNGSHGKSPTLLERTDTDRLEDMVNNILSMRTELFKTLSDPRRDVYAECGFQRGPLSAESLQQLYEEDSLASTVVEAMPKEAFRVTPMVYETEEDQVTPFELKFDQLPNTLRGEKSWFQPSSDGEGNPFWEEILNLVIQSRISRYGVCVLGFDDVTTPDGMSYPVTPSLNRQLRFMTSLPESLATINTWETNQGHPRCGKPTSYNVTFNDPTLASGIGIGSGSHIVHWTRVIHVTEGIGTSKVFHQPPLRAVHNEIYSAQKVRGAGPEGYWKSCFPTTVFKTIPQLGGNVKVDRQKILDAYEQLQNGLQKAMVLMGMEAQTILGQIVDPTPFIDMLIAAICIKIRVPVPVFKGYEIGEQASTNNDSDHIRRVRQYQMNGITPRAIVPVFDRLIWAGVLPQPKGYYVEWPAMGTQSDMDKAQVFATRMQGFSTFANGGVEAMLPPFDMLTREAGYTDEEANAVLGAAQEALKSPEFAQGGASPLLSMVGGITGMIELLKSQKELGLSEEQVKQQIMLFYKVDEATADKLIEETVTAELPIAEEV